MNEGITTYNLTAQLNPAGATVNGSVVNVTNLTGVMAITGAPGAKGDTGATGQGVPAGGTTNQVLAKKSATDYDTQWVNQSGGGGTALPADAAGWLHDNGTGTLAWTTPAKADVGLGNVDNTSDATKNSATATLTNKTMSGASNTFSNIPESAITNLTTDLAAKQGTLTLTTTGTSGAATLSGNTLNIPQYAGGSASNTAFFNVKSYGAKGDGTTDDTTAIQNAINGALASTSGTGAVYFPAGIYKISATLSCSAATSTNGGGQGVYLLGEGHNSVKIRKTFSTGPAVQYLGYGGPNANPSVMGGLTDITLDGNSLAGGLLHTDSAQQMFFRSSSFINSADYAWDFNTMQDSYFAQCTFNNCGSTTVPVINIYGSANGTSNMLWFDQIRVESFYNGAVWIKRGAGATGGGNNGFFFSQCKFENYPQVNGDFCVFDSYTQQLYMDQIFFSAGNYNTGYSTPFNAILFGSASASPGFNQATFSNIFMNTGPTANIGNSVIKINDNASMSGTVKIDNVFLDATPTTGIVDIHGANNLTLELGLIGGSGTRITGDGTGTRYDITATSGGGTVTSVAVSGGTTGLTTSGGPITGSGTITLGGTLAVANGGTGATTQQAAINALTGTQSAGKYLRSDGTNATLAAIVAADVPTLNQNTTGSAATLTTGRTFQTNLASTAAATFNGSANVTPGVTGTLPVANGGTGAATLTGLVKGNGTAAMTAAAAGTDYLAPSSTISTRINPRVSSATSSATPSVSTDSYDGMVLSAQAAAITSFTLSGTPVDQQKFLIRIKATGAYAITAPTNVASSGVASFPTTTVSGKTISAGLIYDATAAKWVVMAVDTTGY